MKLYYNSANWNWLSPVECGYLEMENTTTNEGFELKCIDDVASYLALWRFNNDYVHFDYIREAIVNCAKKLGCIYHDVDELEHDIRKYYI